ncbi:MAG TPA: terpene synthase family protein [Polyangiaceae bacterium]|nr:terpene synthase family protein [Polyangiaceae bacterium]
MTQNAAEHSFNFFTIEWLEHFGAIRDPDELRRVVRTAPGELALLGFGHGEPRRVQLCADLIGWLFLFDDRFADGELRRQPAQLAAIHARLTNILRLEIVAPENPIEACLQHLFERFAAHAPEHWVRRLGDSVRLYFEGCELEARCRAAGTRCSLEEYLVIRLLSVGVYPMLDLVEFTQDAFLGECEVGSELVAGARRAATLSTAMTNDLYSSHKESLEDDSFNAVLVVSQDEGLSFQAAFERIQQLQRGFHEQFAEFEAKLLNAQCSSAVRAFLGGASVWMEGNRQWSASCARYNQLKAALAVH